jgi:hypothetical protein
LKRKSKINSQTGIAHYLIPLIMIVVIALIGSYVYLSASSAATSTGAYYFDSGVYGKCLDDAYDQSTNGTKVQSYACNKGAAQQWTLNSNGTIENPNGKCIDNDAAKNSNDNPITVYTCSPANKAEQWVSTGNILRNPATDKCIDIPYANTQNGTPLQLYSCNGKPQQEWAKVATGSSASGGSGSGTTAPNINPSVLNCEPHPSQCGYPDATNTGILSGITLTKVPSQASSGNNWSYSSATHIVTITGSIGTASSGLDLATGVEAVIPDGVDNITVDNLKLDGVSGGQSDNGITVGTNTCQTDGCGPNNVTIENCSVSGVSPTGSGAYQSGVYMQWQAKNVSVKDCNISGASGGIYYLEEDGTELTSGNYIHDPGASSTAVHVDGITSTSGPPDSSSSWLVQDNTVLLTGTPGAGQVTSAISLFPDGGPQINDHATINENLLDTNNYYLIDNGYGDAFGSAGQSYINITNNRLGSSGNNAGTYNYTWYISPNSPGCTTGNGGVACTGDVESGNFWDKTGLAAK